MNKKTLALGLLLSSVAANASDAATTPAATPAATTPAATTPAATPAATTPAATTPAATPAEGYFSSAWTAVKSNRTMTAALVASAFFLGAVAHAAVSTNDVEEDNE